MVIDDALGDEVKVTVIAAGFEGGQLPRRQPGITRHSDVRPAPKPVVAPRPVEQPAEPRVPVAAPAPAYEAPALESDDDLDVPDFLK